MHKKIFPRHILAHLTNLCDLFEMFFVTTNSDWEEPLKTQPWFPATSFTGIMAKSVRVNQRSSVKFGP